MQTFTKITLTFLICLSFSFIRAQKPKVWTAVDIYQGMEKLNFLGSALYVAAHPDDENTRLIAYLSNESKAHTAYLSLTRGDGGQNLIGPEIRELLGVIRTQELLAARRIDGGHQLFTRANDFGYSKTPEETLEIWDKDQVLADVVWAIRKWQPDIIVNRFSHDKKRRTHGHHTASAMLSYEAFDLTGDEKSFPEQLKYVSPWQPSRLFFNTSWWFYGNREAFESADKSNMTSVDIGTYYPLLGKSNSEIASESRSMHKCQGFGSTGSRGTSKEYLELLKGMAIEEEGNLFAGINTSWTRLEGGAPIGKMVEELIEKYNFSAPYESVPALIEIYNAISSLPDSRWKDIKQKETEMLIEGCMGLYLEAVANDFSATPGEKISLEIEATNRSPVPLKIKSFVLLPMRKDTSLDIDIKENLSIQFKQAVVIPNDAEITSPYWLKEKGSLGMYKVDDQLLRGLPESQRFLKAAFILDIQGKEFTLVKDVIFKRNDPVDGEVVRPFEILKPIYANLESGVFVFEDENPKPINVTLKAQKAGLEGTLRLDLPRGWKASPSNINFSLQLKGEEASYTFNVTPPKGQGVAEFGPIVSIDGNTFNEALSNIEYDHIPPQMVAQESKAKFVRIDLKKAGNKIGYLMGAGDDIPSSLRQIGYQVDLLQEKDIKAENLAQYDAVIAGVRAYNTLDRMPFYQPELLQYVKNGGTYIVQYNTSFRLKIPEEELAPYPLKLSRDRVTVEEAPVTFLYPKHKILNFPNKITKKDFDGWVQERGLYFPNEWGSEFIPILSCHDPGEDPKAGSLLVAEYGKGHYIYTGLSFFRELPPGVPGAYRLFVNLISIDK